MLNMLVVDDNIFFTKSLINNVVKENPDIRLCMIATNGKEALDALNTQKIDLILLDLKLPEYSGLDILEFLIRYNNIYNNSVIVISGESEMILKVRNNPLVYSYINKGAGMENIIKEINQLVFLKKEEVKKEEINNKRKKLVRQQIRKELYKIGYTDKYAGTKYIADTIYLQYFIENKKNIKLKNDIYPIISQKYNMPVNTVKCDIITATRKVKDSVPEEHIKQYFGFFWDKKITPKLVINTVLKKIII